MPQQNGERIVINDSICDMVNDAFGHHSNNNDMEEDDDVCPEASQTIPDDIIELLELMRDGEQSLYEGCDKYSKLSFSIKFYHVKCLCRMSDKAMSMILELLADAFEHAKIPCSFYEAKKIILCSKVLKVDELDQLQSRVVLTLCHMEMLFPPSFFTVMVHLIVHLVEDAKLGGPVQYRWMYPIERYLGKLKSYVRNKAQPEGSIAEGYLAEEILTFCSRYLDGIETKFNRLGRVDDEPDDIVPSSVSTLFPPIGKPVGGFTYFTLSPREKLQAHRHVLTNCTQVDPFLQEFRDILRRQLRRNTRSSSEIDKRVHREFVEWFSRRIRNDSNGSYSNDLKFLAMGPITCAKRYTAYNINGLKFRTLERDQGLKTQNNGIFGTFGTRSYASSSDNQMQFGGVPYYGKLVDIIELNYHGQFSVTLFKCMWANITTRRGIVTDDLGFTSVSFSHLIHTGDNDDDEPYIRAPEA
uniref:DUF4218 domain-containing protein n=1 Tax=Cajanus cajan TaxID=3821 RepID=A0A151RB25_CAJCA|nr:hypothetical protein KK1_038992 [Cajanus cajan]